MSAVPVCIDISHHQGYPDFDEVRASGVRGIIHKATEGTSFVDGARAENCANARSAGLAVATYHWLSPGSDPRAQMEFYLSVIDPVRRERVVVDYEQDGCTLAMLREAVAALMDCDYGLRITVYSGHLLKEQLGDDRDEFLSANTDLWLAQYTSGEPSWSNETYPEWALWQYSETGELPGIDDAYVDFNEFDGDEEEFLRWIAPAPPEPTPEPTAAAVDVTIVTPEGIEVRVSVNGHMVRQRWRRRRLRRRGPDLAR